MMLFNTKNLRLKLIFIAGITSLWVNSASANCNKISSPFQDYLIYFNFGSSLYIDPATPVGTIIAQQIISGDQLNTPNNGWVGICNNNNANNQIGYWWLEQHNSASPSRQPVAGVTAPTADGHMYIMNDNGRNNPYGGSGSGSVGYTVELLTNGSALPFSEVGGSPPINIPPLATGGPISGIPCDDARSGNSPYPAFTGNCNSNQFIFNWAQLGSFQMKVTLYRLAGTVPVSGLIMSGNGGDRSFSLMSLMDTASTPPSFNKNMFNLTRLALSSPVALQTSPCQAFTYPTVNLNKVNRSAFTTLGQPANGVTDTPVNVSAQCSANTAIKWAVMGTSDSYDPDGNQGILALDASESTASGVGVQLTDTSGNPLPITPVNSVNYRWIDTNLTSNSSGILLIPFLARYVRVGDVEPGIADSHAYLVISPK